MKKLLLLLCFAALTGLAEAQSTCPNQPVNGGYYTPVCPTVTASGATITVPNLVGAFNASFEELMTGTPATVSVVIQGCFRGGTCDAASDTNTTVASGVVRSVAFAKLYTYFLVTVAWTGGTSPTVTVNPALSTARFGSGGFTTAAQVVAAFSGCSGTKYLAADTNCYTAAGVPGGSNAQLQYNNSSAFGGVSQWTTNGTTTINGSATSVLDLHLAAVAGLFLPGALNTGLVKVTTSTGAVSTAVGADLPSSGIPNVAYKNAANTYTAGINDFTGATSILVPTQSAGDSSTKGASTAFVTTAVNNAIAGVNPAVAVQAATTQISDTSSYTYLNGVSGIGATLTGPTNNVAVVIDGFTFTAVGQRLLVKNDTQAPSGAFNGIYSLTILQGVANKPVLTRALDYNQPSDMNNTGAIPVVNGTANAQTQWVQTSQVATVGTDAVTFTQFTLNPTTVVTSAASLTNNAFVTGAGGQASKTPSSTATLDSSGNAVFPGSVSTGTAPVACGTATGCSAGTEGTAANMTPTANQDACTWDSTLHGEKCTINNGAITASTRVLQDGNQAHYLNGTGAWGTPSGGVTTGYYSIPLYYNGGNNVKPTANQLGLVAFAGIPAISGINKIVFNVEVADGTNNSSICIYSGAGALVAHTAPATYGTTGMKVVATVESNASIPAGKVYLGYTSVAATIGFGSGNTFTATPYAASTFAVTSGGACPGSISPPSDSWANSPTTVPALSFAP